MYVKRNHLDFKKHNSVYVIVDIGNQFKDSEEKIFSIIYIVIVSHKITYYASTMIFRYGLIGIASINLLCNMNLTATSFLHTYISQYNVRHA
jgi:hypothetical protein